MSLSAQDPQKLRDLGKRLDDAEARRAVRAKRPAQAQSGIAGRLVTELVAAIAGGSGIGWGTDWLFGYFGIHTKPVFLIVFFMLGAAAGFLGVIRTANKINAEAAGTMPVAPAPTDDDEE